MSERTNKKLKQHKAALPVMRKKLQAAAIMLLVAIIISSTATYAWMTFSEAPAASHIVTTFISNGSLEIGLSGVDGSQPEEFDVDESVGINSNVVVSNRRWGNIINLSDPSYGMDKIMLRPARLNTSNLATKPLSCYAYDETGRPIEDSIVNCTYTAYDGAQFSQSTEKGVRAISSYTEVITDASQTKRREKEKEVAVKQNAVNTYYKNNIPGKMAALSDMISTYAQEKVNGTEYAPSGATVPLYFSKSHLQSAKELYDVLYEAMELQKEAYIALANYQLFVTYGDNCTPYTSFDEFSTNHAKYNVNSPNGISTDGVVCLQGLTTFVNDYNALVTDREHFRKYVEDKWAENTYSFSTGGDEGYTINYMIARLIDYSNMYIIYNGTKYKVTQLQSLGTGLLDLNGNTYPCYIVNGIMKRFEQIAISEDYRLPKNASGGKTSIKIAMKVKKIITINFSVYGECYTEASGDSYFGANFAAAQNVGSQDFTIVAKEIYAMAVDFWVRCNAESTYLTLGGATTVDTDGNVLQYDGINRVWGSTNSAGLPSNSTTQGNGSCYVYYADTPEDMDRSLSLLRGYRVAFVSNGSLIAQAVMDTNNYYAVNGRITVPLVIDTTYSVPYTYVDSTNAEQQGYAITQLYVDKPKAITAIIYLAGEDISNADVLAATEIEGQLNIQFASSNELTTVGDDDLQNATRTVTAGASLYKSTGYVEDDFKYQLTMDYDNATNDNDLTTRVKVDIEGATPHNVVAYFMRAINATQGQREEVTVFTQQTDGSWTADHTFKKPGTYYLRYVRLDGIDYTLFEPIKIEVVGFELDTVSWNISGDVDEHTVYTVDNNFKVDVTVKYAYTGDNRDKLPTRVQARFSRDDGVMVFADLNYRNGAFTGTASFQTSGHYTLEYLVQFAKTSETGSYVDLVSKELSKSLTLYLGMYADVFDTSGDLEIVEEYDAEMAKEGTYYKDVIVRIYDNAGNLMEDLDGAILKYKPGTVDTNLKWDEDLKWYTGTLQITKAGRYEFSSIVVAGNNLTRARVSPIYTIVPPDPPEYDASVASEFASTVQFAPFTNDAYIGPIGLKHVESAQVAATVTNSLSGETYVCNLATEANTPGTIYIDSAGYGWVYLPTYTTDVDTDGNPLSNAFYTQEGVWTLTSVAVWDCYDSNSKLVEEDKPMVFATSLPKDFETGTLVATNLSAHNTEVSCTINLCMTDETQELGNSSTPFMTKQSVAGYGIAISLVDDAGRTIPTSKFASRDTNTLNPITLNYSYYADSSSAYGYKVINNSFIGGVGEITFAWDESVGKFVSNSTVDWRYVGQYKITTLSVTMKGGNMLTVDLRNLTTVTVSKEITNATGEGTSNTTTIATIENGASGVPAYYSIRSAAPTADNIKVIVNNSTKPFNGTFLQSYEIDTRAKVQIVYTDENNVEQTESNVKISDEVPSLQLTYVASSKPSGFSWSNSSYESITLAMVSNGSYFEAPSTPLLPGTYKQIVKYNGNDYAAKNITVTASLPTLKVTSVNPDSSTKFNMNLDTSATSESEVTYGKTDINPMQVQNYLSADGLNALVFIKAEIGHVVSTSGEEADGSSGSNELFTVFYSLPEVTVQLSGIGSVSFSKIVANATSAEAPNYANTFEFTTNLSQTVQVGSITTMNVDLGAQGCSGRDFDYQQKHEALTQTFGSVRVTYNGIDYTIPFSSVVTIREPDSQLPTANFKEKEGYNSYSSITSVDGGPITITLPTAESFGEQPGERVETLSEGGDWSSPKIVTEYLAYIKSDKKHVYSWTKKILGFSISYSSPYYEVTYDKWKKTTKTSEQTGNTIALHSVVNGLVGWEINGEEYAPGATVTIDSVVTIIPIIGELRITDTEVKTTTIIKEEITYEHIEEETITWTGYSRDKYTDGTEAEALANYPGLPSGYSFFNGAGSWVQNGEHISDTDPLRNFVPDTKATTTVITKQN